MAKTEVKIKHESMALFFTLKKKCESDPAMSNLGHTWTEKKRRLRSRESAKLSFIHPKIVAPTPRFNYDYALSYTLSLRWLLPKDYDLAFTSSCKTTWHVKPSRLAWNVFPGVTFIAA